MNHYAAMYEEKTHNGKKTSDGPSHKSTRYGITSTRQIDLQRPTRSLLSLDASSYRHLFLAENLGTPPRSRNPPIGLSMVTVTRVRSLSPSGYNRNKTSSSLMDVEANQKLLFLNSVEINRCQTPRN